MATQIFPGRQHTISHSGIESSRKHFESCCKHYGATDADIRLDSVESTPRWEQPQYNSRATLAWDTYVGWKAYMLFTGCFASDSRYEKW